MFSWFSCSKHWKNLTDIYSEPKLTSLGTFISGKLLRSPEDDSEVSGFDGDIFFVFLKAQ